jgi:hypothetical protein
VFTDDDRQALVEQGEAAELHNSGFDPRGKAVAILTPVRNLYAIEQGPILAGYFCRQGAGDVRIVRPSIWRGAEPLRDWIGSDDQAVAILHTDAEIADPFPVQIEVATQQNGDGLNFSIMTDRELGIVRLVDVQERPTEWYWKYRVARGEMTLEAGEGGLGKSQLLLALAAASSRGSILPDGSGPAPVGGTIILSAEDSPETTIKPRLMAMGADLSRIVILQASVTISRAGKEPLIHPVSLRDRDYWMAVFDRLRGTVLFIVDPIPSYLGRGVNDQRNNEIREVIEPFLANVIRPRRIAMFANTHLNKCVDAKTPLHRITGSMAYGALPRNVHFVVRDPEDPERRFLKQAKSNNSPDDLPAVAFRIEKRTVQSAAGEIETAIPVFDAQTVNVDLVHLMNSEKSRRGPQRSDQSNRLAEWVYDYLVAEGRPVQAGPLYDAAAAAFSNERPNPLGEKKPDGRWSNGTVLHRAADRVPMLPTPRDGKRVERFQDATTHRWYWQLVGKDAAF